MKTAKYIIILGACLLVASCAISQFGPSAPGKATTAASLVAAGVVWIPFSAALWMTAVAARNASNPFAVIQATLLGTIVRTVVPFGVGLWLSRRGDDLAAAGVFGFIVIHYFVAWAVETPLVVRLISQRKVKSAAGSIV